MEEQKLNTNPTTTSTSPQPNSNSPIKSNKPKIFFILFVILSVLIAFIAGGVVLREPLSIFDAFKSPIDIVKPQKPCPAIARVCNDGQTAKLGTSCTQTCPEDSTSLTPTIILNLQE